MESRQDLIHLGIHTKRVPWIFVHSFLVFILPTPHFLCPSLAPSISLSFFFLQSGISPCVVAELCGLCCVCPSWQLVQKKRQKSRLFIALVFFSFLSSLLPFTIFLFFCALYYSSHSRLHPLQLLPPFFACLWLLLRFKQEIQQSFYVCKQKGKNITWTLGHTCFLHFRTTT